MAIKTRLLLILFIILALVLCFAVNGEPSEKTYNINQNEYTETEVRNLMTSFGKLSQTDLKSACDQESRLIDEIWMQNPDFSNLDFYLYKNLRRLEKIDLDAAEQKADRFSEDNNENLRTVAKSWQRTNQLRKEPLDMVFTAIDGREVDLKSLRGKVVVVEFTGVTWCPACRVAEEKLKELYEKYQGKGLEIVAVTQEYEENREEVADLIQERDLPWPHSFDGLAHESPLIKRFGIWTFPTTFVLDRSGLLYAHNPRTEDLEKVIVKALERQRSTARQADNDYTDFKKMLAEKPWRNSNPNLSKEDIVRVQNEHRHRVQTVGMEFYEGYPDDARRWEVVLDMSEYPPLFFTAPSNSEKKDLEAMAAWSARDKGLRQELLNSSDAPIAMREQTEWMLFASDLYATLKAQDRGESYDYAPLRSRFEAHIAKYMDLEVMAERARYYLWILDYAIMFDVAAETCQKLLIAPNAALRKMAQERLAYFELHLKPLDWSFTAHDGRVVDFNELRGKVVLVQFWATWCAPCIKKLPNIKQVYADFHNKGFEVVGIALENAELDADDTPEQREKKLTEMNQQLIEFSKEWQLPWPHYADGKNWQSEPAVKYGISGVPAMLLLDQKGMIVSKSAYGEKLRKEVIRLLQ